MTTRERYLVLRPTSEGAWLAACGLGGLTLHLGTWDTEAEAEHGGLVVMKARVLVLSPPLVVRVLTPTGSAEDAVPAALPTRYWGSGEPPPPPRRRSRDLRTLAHAAQKAARESAHGGACPWRTPREVPGWAITLAAFMFAPTAGAISWRAVWRRALEDVAWREAFTALVALSDAGQVSRWLVESCGEAPS